MTRDGDTSTTEGICEPVVTVLTYNMKDKQVDFLFNMFIVQEKKTTNNQCLKQKFVESQDNSQML